MIKIEGQQEIKKKLSARERHGATEVERALSYFIDPQNSFLQVQRFAAIEAMYLVGDGSQKIIDNLTPLADRLEAARRFDKTYIGHMLSQPSIPALYGTWLATMVDSNTV